MRYGIISDIHGNLEALNAVLEELSKERVDRYVCLGDLVGYGANPNECVELVRGLTDRVVAGNHDWAAVGMTDIAVFNPHAREAVLWTARCLTEAPRSYLKELPLEVTDGEVLFVHATPEAPEEWHYILSPYEAGWYLDAMGRTQRVGERSDALRARICFIGHSHRPVTFARDDDGRDLILGTSFRIEPDWRYIVNAGSVGQPRDGDPRACYAVFDAEEGTAEIKRIVYDIEKAQRKILWAGLPAVEAERLAYGE